jgi:hypothetical protein
MDDLVLERSLCTSALIVICFYFPFLLAVCFARSLPACGRARRALGLFPPVRGTPMGKLCVKRNLHAFRAMSLSNLTMTKSGAPIRLNSSKQT